MEGGGTVDDGERGGERPAGFFAGLVVQETILRQWLP